jgi:hypothetical protein
MNLVAHMESNVGVCLIFNKNKISIAINKFIDFDVDNEQSEFALGYCFWTVQPSLLVKENKIIGLTYGLEEEDYDLVYKWVNDINDSHLKLKRTIDTQYYNISDWGDSFFVEIYWILETPDRVEGVGMTEDFWIYSKKGKDDIDGLRAIGLSYPNDVADDYDLEWCPDLIE